MGTTGNRGTRKGGSLLLLFGLTIEDLCQGAGVQLLFTYLAIVVRGTLGDGGRFGLGVNVGHAIFIAHYLDRFGMNRGEFFSMLFFSTMGMIVIVSALDLIALFIGIELMSLAIYVLVAFRRRDMFSNEAALKYFLIGAFAIGFFLYGVSIIYGLTGSTSFSVLATSIAEKNLAHNPAFLLAIALILAGLGFKVSAVPFHMWTPDAYQGAPTPITGFMATAVKASRSASRIPPSQRMETSAGTYGASSSGARRPISPKAGKA